MQTTNTTKRPKVTTRSHRHTVRNPRDRRDFRDVTIPAREYRACPSCGYEIGVDGDVFRPHALNGVACPAGAR